MRRSFYHYLMTLRGPDLKNQEMAFANHVAADIQFPKQSENYHDVSSYLEIEAHYLNNMDLFDQLWEKYLENNQ